MFGRVVAVAAAPRHDFSKWSQDRIRLLPRLGVEGDAHAGRTVKHRSRVARDPTQPNLRQVHLIHAELLAELQVAGFDVPPGAMGENITTAGLDLLSMPAGTRLHLGTEAAVEITGLRNPCLQLDRYQPGLMRAVLGRTATGEPVRKAGVMAIVLAGGSIEPGDAIEIDIPPEPHIPLAVI